MLTCPNCGNDTVRLSRQRWFYECPCGWSVLVPGAAEQAHELHMAQKHAAEDHAAFMRGIKLLMDCHGTGLATGEADNEDDPYPESMPGPRLVQRYGGLSGVWVRSPQ